MLKLKYGAERAHIAKVLSHSRLTLRTPTLRVADSEREAHASLLTPDRSWPQGAQGDQTNSIWDADRQVRV